MKGMAKNNVPLPVIQLFPPTGKCQRNEISHNFLNPNYCTPKYQTCWWITRESDIIFSTILSTVETSFIETLIGEHIEVELATRGQSDNPNCFAHKQNKITASVCKDIFSHMNKSRSMMPSVRRVSALESRDQPDNDDEEDQDLFITMVASWGISHTSFERTHRVNERPQRGKRATPPGGQGSAWKYWQTKSH